MFKRKQWLAVIQGNHWVVAKVARRKLKLDILSLSEFHTDAKSDVVQSPEIANELLPFEGFHTEKQASSGNNSELKAWLKKMGVPVKKLRLAVSCPGVITRMITLPLMSAQDLNQLLTEQVDQYFTLNIQDYIVDYRVLEHFKEDGEQRQRVLLAALPKYQWQGLWAEWEEIGFKPQVVDLAAAGLARLYSQLVIPLDLAIIELNANRVEFILLDHGVFFLYSDFEVSLEGLDQVTKTLQNATLGCVEETLAESQSVDYQTANLHEWARTEIETSLGNVLQSVSEFFSFFAARHFGKSIDRIYLTGDYSTLPYLKDIFETNLEVPTEAGFPNGWRPHFKRKLRNFQKDGMKYGSLYGLAMRED